MGVFSVSKISYVFCGVFHNYISCVVVQHICVVVCLSMLIFCLCFQMVSPNYERRGIINRVGGTPNLGAVQSTCNPKMLTFYVWFCFLCKFVAYYTM